MVQIRHKDIVPVGTALIFAGVFFFLGLLFSNLPYDYKTLYTPNASAEDFANSIQHYKTWYQTPTVALHILHFFIGLGIVGMAIKIYKPDEEVKYFEYGSLLLYVLAICIYLTNLKVGAESASLGNWGEVDEGTGVNVIAASQAMIIFLLGFIIALQAGLYFAQIDYQQRLEQFNKEVAEEEAAAATTVPATGKTTATAPVFSTPKEKKPVAKPSGSETKSAPKAKSKSKKNYVN